MPIGIYDHYKIRGSNSPAKRLEVRKKISEATKREKHWNWKGGISKMSDYRKKYNKRWKEQNREYIIKYHKEYFKQNKESFRKRSKEYRKRNKKYLNNYAKKRQRRRRLRIEYRINANISTAIWFALRNKKAGRHWEKLVGYTLQDLMLHLEVQFDNKMSWNNYGSYWWIDHIKPKSIFKYEKPKDEEFKKCWALENLQPLEKIENIRKSNH